MTMTTRKQELEFMGGNVAKLAETEMIVYSVVQPMPLMLTFGFWDQDEFLISICEAIYATGGERQVWIQEGDIV